MSYSSDIIVGLDIGTTKICALVGRRTPNGKIEIIGVGKTESLGVQRGVVVNIDKTVSSIRESMLEAHNSSNAESLAVVNVGIAGQHIKSLQHRHQIIRKSLEEEISQGDIDLIINEMYKLAMPPGEEIIHVFPQEFTVDSEQGIREPIGMSGTKLEANCHIITGQVAAINNIFKCVRKADLEIDNIILEPIASSDAVLTSEEREAGVVLVDIGGGTTDVAIFQDGIIRHTAVIPMGGNLITEDIKEGCAIIRHQAEMLKMKFGSALARENSENEIVAIPGLRGREPKEISLKNLAHIIQSRVEEIIEHVYYEIRHSGFEKKLIAGIVVTGGGANLRHIRQLFEYMTGMDTRIGYPNEYLEGGVSDYLKNPMYATGIGLVMRGLESAEKRKTKTATKPAVEEIRNEANPIIADAGKRENLFERQLKRLSNLFSEEDELL